MTNQNHTENMIRQQLRTGDVLNDTILNLFRELPREDFVPDRMKPFACSDLPIPLAHDQQMMTPLEEGRILQALMLNGSETVLEVGTGTGYLTALLSRQCKKVISVDYFEDFTASAKEKLQRHHCDNVELITGDACRGWLELAPYDVIVLTAALDHIDETHRLQLLPGGRMFAVIGKEPAMKGMFFSLDHEGRWTEKMLFNTCVPSMITKFPSKKFDFQDHPA
jgi:protein-L-isoaspartate(D-aspartate) O-methyltransferase